MVGVGKRHGHRLLERDPSRRARAAVGAKSRLALHLVVEVVLDAAEARFFPERGDPGRAVPLESGHLTVRTLSATSEPAGDLGDVCIGRRRDFPGSVTRFAHDLYGFDERTAGVGVTHSIDVPLHAEGGRAIRFRDEETGTVAQTTRPDLYARIRIAVVSGDPNPCIEIGS